MKKILFVDDETRILEGLQRMLYHKQDEWDMVFASSGEDALALLAKDKFNVIVSDMRMPKMDGATLLKETQDSYPDIVRIVLSGYAEMETTLRAVPVAHQFLAKPSDSDHIEDVINRACQLQALLKDDLVRSIVGKIDKLPVLPKTYRALTKALADSRITLKEIAEIIEQDIAITAKILQLVNSAFFSLPRRVTNVANAVSFIGLNMLKNLALSVEVFHSFEGNLLYPEADFEHIQQHSLLCGNIAKQLLTDKQKAEDAFIAGILHDIGKLIAMTFLPAKYCRLTEKARQQQQELYQVEKELVGITHTEIGAYLLGIWGLPYPIVEAVANHHEPMRVPQRGWDVLGAVYVADRLSQSNQEIAAPLDMNYLESLGVSDQLPHWRDIADAAKQHKEL